MYLRVTGWQFKQISLHECASAFSWDESLFQLFINLLNYLCIICWQWVGGRLLLTVWGVGEKSTMLHTVDAVLPFIGMHKIALVMYTSFFWPAKWDGTWDETHTKTQFHLLLVSDKSVSWKYAPVSRAIAPIAAAYCCLFVNVLLFLWSHRVLNI